MSVATKLLCSSNFINLFSSRINTLEGTATGQDYTGNRQEITIDTSDPSTYIASIPIINDDIVDGDETFRVQIDASFILVTNDGATLQVTIQDDDSKLMLTSCRRYGFIYNLISSLNFFLYNYTSIVLNVFWLGLLIFR